MDKRREVAIGDIYHTWLSNRYWIITGDTDDMTIFEYCNESGKIISDKAIKMKCGVSITFLSIFIRNINDG